MRNWPQTVPGASFRGFSFEVEKEGLGGAGRHVALHSFVKAETHATEDTGRKARKFKVSAYIVGDDADTRARAFVEVCSTPGAATLILPMTRPGQVRCLDCSTNNEKTRQGLVAFDLEFIEAGADAGGFPAIQLGDRIAQSALDGLGAAVSAVLSAFPF
ncbi:DNA circularization N-terminal domain-containing protein [uncultured Methylobacterium sp.]|uniref:DNA circularization N-terminal domain-containing protein n=1 Tax=uncultured Methylobacterium sp. TaxID=157278 RepID=UPI0035CA06E2